METAFYNALSGTFPKGGPFFVESVRQFRDGTPPKLAVEIKAFVSQEVMHSAGTPSSRDLIAPEPRLTGSSKTCATCSSRPLSGRDHPVSDA